MDNNNVSCCTHNTFLPAYYRSRLGNIVNLYNKAFKLIVIMFVVIHKICLYLLTYSTYKKDK